MFLSTESVETNICSMIWRLDNVSHRSRSKGKKTVQCTHCVLRHHLSALRGQFQQHQQCTSTYALEKQKLHDFCHLVSSEFLSLHTGSLGEMISEEIHPKHFIWSNISGRVYQNLNNVVMFRPRPFQSSRWDIIARIKLSFGIIMMLLWWRNQDSISKIMIKGNLNLQLELENSRKTNVCNFLTPPPLTI